MHLFLPFLEYKLVVEDGLKPLQPMHIHQYNLYRFCAQLLITQQSTMGRCVVRPSNWQSRWLSMKAHVSEPVSLSKVPPYLVFCLVIPRYYNTLSFCNGKPVVACLPWAKGYLRISWRQATHTPVQLIPAAFNPDSSRDTSTMNWVTLPESRDSHYLYLHWYKNWPLHCNHVTCPDH